MEAWAEGGEGMIRLEVEAGSVRELTEKALAALHITLVPMGEGKAREVASLGETLTERPSAPVGLRNETVSAKTPWEGPSAVTEIRGGTPGNGGTTLAVEGTGGPTLEDVQAAVASVRVRVKGETTVSGGAKRASAVLTACGYRKVTDVPVERYQAVIDQCRAIMDGAVRL